MGQYPPWLGSLGSLGSRAPGPVVRHKRQNSNKSVSERGSPPASQRGTAGAGWPSRCEREAVLFVKSRGGPSPEVSLGYVTIL